MDCIVTSTNNYMMLSCNSTNMSSRIYKYSPTNHNEMYKLFGLLILISQNQKPTLRCSFSNNPQYYQPIFSNIMSGRRFEVLLWSVSCERLPTAQPLIPDCLSKIQPVLDTFLLVLGDVWKTSIFFNIDVFDVFFIFSKYLSCWKCLWKSVSAAKTQ